MTTTSSLGFFTFLGDLAYCVALVLKVVSSYLALLTKGTQLASMAVS